MLMLSTIVAVSLLAAGQQAPADWDQTTLRASRLMLDGKTAQAIALLERVVAAAPGFEAAQYELARAHDFRASELAVAGPAQDQARRRHLEQAARLYRQVADRHGQYRQPALGWLLAVYDVEQLDEPVERAAAARQYVAMAPRSWIGHVALAGALLKSGQDAASWAALDAARAAVSPDDASALTRAILKQLTEVFPFVTPGSAAAGPAPPQELGRLLDYADAALARELAKDPADRDAAMARAAALSLRAQRLERDPARRKALEAEAERLIFRGAARREPPATAAAAPAEVPGTPPGFTEASTRAASLIEKQQHAEAAAVYETFIASHPSFVPPHYLRVDALIRGGRSAAVEPALRAARKAIPATPEARHTGAVYLEELVRKNPSISAADGTRALTEAIALLDEALASRPDHFETLVYKSLAVRGQARFAADPAAARALTAEADRLRAAAKAAMEARQPPR